ncbi:MAG: substrate-binding periplasmic protein [Pseudomonadota bacterium]
MKFRALLILPICLFIVSGCDGPPARDGGGSSGAGDSTFSTVVSRGTINCGFIAYQPAIYTDEKGKVVGIFAETMERAAQNLDLKVNWIEGNWPDLIPNLTSKRWDAYCGSAWKNAPRIKAADFGTPLYYSYLSVWAAGGTGLDLASLNRAELKVAVLDGDTSLAVANQRFPEVTQVSLTELNSYSDLFDLVVSGRADFTIAEASYVDLYLRSKGDKALESVGAPIQIYPNAMMFRKEDDDLRRALDGAIEELVNQGFLDEKIMQYAEGQVLPLAKPYQMP